MLRYRGVIGCVAALLAVTFVVFASVASAQELTTIYTGYAASTKAFKTRWESGYADSGGFTGNFAKTQHLMAKVAKLVYHDESQAKIELWELGFRLEAFMDESSGFFGLGDGQAVIARDLLGRMVVLSVRGSQEGADWFTDGFAVPFGSLQQHKGFYDQAMAFKQAIISKMGKFCTPGSEELIWLTGHSLGGAVASILAQELEASGCHVSGVSTFGSPRAGLLPWHNWYKSRGVSSWDLYYRTQRWVNANDPVYCLPPGGEWRPVGIENYIDENQNIFIKNNVSGSICTDADGWLKFWKVTLALLLPAEHLGTYLGKAILDWNSGLINLVFQCSPGLGWDDLWSLGTCLFDTTGRLASLYHLTPVDLLDDGIRLVQAEDHESAHYVDALDNVNFDDMTTPIPIVPPALRTITFQVNTPLGATVKVSEALTGARCKFTPQSTSACQMTVPFNERVTLTVETIGGGWASWSSGQCASSNDSTGKAGPCSFQVNGNANISVHWGTIL